MNIKEVTSGISIVYGFSGDSKAVEKILKQCKFEKFSINNKTLCRLGSFEGDQCKDTSAPWLRCPSIEKQKIYPWSPVICEIKDLIQKQFGVLLNIAKIQEYKDGKAYITPHCDKILDLDTETPIFIARFGATRTCELIHKISQKKLVIDVPHDSLLVISYKANQEWLHGIPKDPSVTEPSYSIVFRKSVTFKTANDLVFGERTPFPTIDQITSTGDFMSREKQRLLLIEAFTKENHTIADLDIYKNIIEKSIYAY